MQPSTLDNRSILEPLFGNGRFMLLFGAFVILMTGLFFIVQSALGYFLPHDVNYIGLTAQELSKYYEGRITKFMFHDRVAFGGSMMSVGIIYLWLNEFPLRQQQAWAWWVYFLSTCIGYGSFLTYLGYGYLDTWHGIGILLLAPFLAVGLLQTYKQLPKNERSIKSIFQNQNPISFQNSFGIGIFLLQFTAFGLFLGGIVIMIVGMTTVFVPEDLAFMQITHCSRSCLEKLNPNLIPLIAHDRACFGGGLATIGLVFWIAIRCSDQQKSLWETLLLSLSVGFGTAIGVHFAVGYTDFIHLLPAYLGVLMYVVGLGLVFRKWYKI